LAEDFVNDPYHKETLENTMTFMNNCAAYPDFYDTGFMNDIEYYKVKIPFDQVKVPVHMIHGTADPDIFYTQAEQAHAGIADSILVTLENAGHTLQISPMYKEAFAQ
jgi:pimeloyl-ACP methyl ester carboxylesterase